MLSGAEIDESLAQGLEREIDKKEMDDESLKLFCNNTPIKINHPARSVPGLKSAVNGCNIAWSGDICLEGTLDLVSHALRITIRIHLFLASSFLIIVPSYIAISN